MYFVVNTPSFNLVNAYFLARISDLIYQPLDSLAPVLLNDYGLKTYKPFQSKATDTQAFLAGNERMLVLAFRGTTTWQDWMTNFSVLMVPGSSGRIHSGFNKALDSIWPEVSDAVMASKERNQTLWITGHSLGGALATLAADRFSEENLELIHNIYTFGQPRVGDSAFARNFDRKLKKRTFRFVDDEDIVTKIPIPPGYTHIGQEYFIDNKGVISNTNNFWAWFRSTSQSVAIRSSADASRYRAENPGGISDHSAAYYAKYIEKNLQKKGQNPLIDYLRGL